MIINNPIGIQRFQYNQNSPSAEWTIAHNLNKEMVNCDVNIDNELSLPYSLDIIDANTVKISWTSPKAGFAIIS